VEENSAGVLPCGHAYCYECIAQWAGVTNHCCLCKSEFSGIALWKFTFLDGGAGRGTTGYGEALPEALGDAPLRPREAALRLHNTVPVAMKRQREPDAEAEDERYAHEVAEEEGHHLSYGEGEDEEMEGEEDWTCTKCTTAHNPELLMKCDGCDKGWHTYCLDTPLDAVPEGLFVCGECEDVWALAKDSAYPTDSLAQFVRMRQEELARARVARANEGGAGAGAGAGARAGAGAGVGAGGASV
jgi:hypothetical protein